MLTERIEGFTGLKKYLNIFYTLGPFIYYDPILLYKLLRVMRYYMETPQVIWFYISIHPSTAAALDVISELCLIFRRLRRLLITITCFWMFWTKLFFRPCVTWTVTVVSQERFGMFYSIILMDIGMVNY